MKRLLPLIFMCLLFACTKEINSPPIQNDSAQANATDAIKKNANKYKIKTVAYTREFYGNSGEGFDITFPAFDINTGTITSWTMVMIRRVNGSITLTNSLNTRNDSAIAISRYLVVTMYPQTIGSYPTTVIKYLPQRLAANQTLTVPIKTTVTDVINSTANNVNVVQGDATGRLTWHFDDLVSAFKPNCINNYSLKDSVTVVVTYSFVQN